jgi:hypothetical protein
MATKLQIVCPGTPRLIEDIVSVVKNLGYRFLWFDRYCIDQSNPQGVHAVVQQMDNLYEQASIMLAAASSKDVDVGLSGVSNIPRYPQPLAFVRNKLYISTLPDLENALQSSYWMTRGWTFQEFLFSERCLVFTKMQVYFVCRAGSCCEAVAGTLDAVSAKSSERTTISAQFLGNDPYRSTGFTRYVELYTARSLTYETDSLRAFQGFWARTTHATCWEYLLRNSVWVSEARKLSVLNLALR